MTAASAIWTWIAVSFLHVFCTAPSLMKWGVVMATCIGFLEHATTLLYPRISYGDHVIVCVTILITSFSFWIWWLVRVYFYVPRQLHAHSNGELGFNLLQRKHGVLILAYMILLFLASMFEIFEISPFFLTFDGHSLWHMCTIVTSAILWQFVSAEHSIKDQDLSTLLMRNKQE